jgi:large repetitive protein
MKALLLPLLFCIALRAQPGSIEGTVVNEADGQPLSGVHITLLPSDFASPQETFGAISDRAGHFSMAAVTPGSYIVMPDHTGFLFAQKATDPLMPIVRVKAGQHLSDFKVRMAARAVIAGRVVDEAGDPLTGVTVSARYDPEQLFLSLLAGSPQGRTDDRGMFRLVVPAGKYYLRAEPFRAGSTEGPEIRSDGSVDATYGATYYPGAASADRATLIDAVAGRDTAGLEIRLVRMQILSLSGVVTGPQGPVAATVWVRSKQFGQAAGTGVDGKFEFNRLESGTYQVYAQVAGKNSLQSQVMEVRLDGGDQTNVQLLLSAGGDVAGKLELGGAPMAGKHAIRLQPVGLVAGGMSTISGGDVDGEGSFNLSNVSPGRYRVKVDAMPEDGYIKTVTLDGVAAQDGILDLTHGVRAAQIKISLGSNAGRLSGTVRDEAGDPSPHDWVLALLVADGTSLDPEISTLTQAGKYDFKGIRPGKYHIAAVDMMSFAGTPDEVAAKEGAAHGEAIEVEEGSRLSKDLKIISKGAADGK